MCSSPTQMQASNHKRVKHLHAVGFVNQISCLSSYHCRVYENIGMERALPHGNHSTGKPGSVLS